MPSPVWILAAVCGVAGGFAVTVPRIGLALAVIPLAVVTFASSRARLVAVVFGGLTVFHSSAALSYVKAAYLLIVLLALLVAWRNMWVTAERTKDASARRKAATASMAMTFLIALSLPVALVNGHPVDLWLRDASPYFLLATAPFLAADFSQSIEQRFLVVTFVLAGSLGALSFCVRFLSIRGLSDVSLEQLLFPGFFLPVALFCYASARSLSGRLTLRWPLTAALVLAALLVSGSRSAFLLLLAPIAIAMTFRGRARSAWRLAFASALGVCIVAASFYGAGLTGVATQEVVDALSRTSGAVTAPEADFSLRDRFNAGAEAWRVFLGAPVAGVGPGHLFEWATAGGIPRQGFTIDSSISVLAKFGVLGTSLLLAFFAFFVRLFRKGAVARNGRMQDDGRRALVGFAAVALAYVPLGNPLEDKGFGLGLLLLLSIALARPTPTLERSSQGDSVEKRPMAHQSSVDVYARSRGSMPRGSSRSTRQRTTLRRRSVGRAASRVLIYESRSHAHSERYARRIVEALRDEVSVSVAAPDEVADRLGDLGVDVLATGTGLASANRFSINDVPRKSNPRLETLARAVANTRADQVLHLSGDVLLRDLVNAPRGRVPLSLVVFRPRAHYPSLFGSRLPLSDRVAGQALEVVLQRWRRRPDAQIVFTLDPFAARGWSMRPGATAVWLPEPPVIGTPRPVPDGDRDGCALVGSLAGRKGIDLLAGAAKGLSPEVKIILCGQVSPGFQAEFDGHVGRLRHAGLDVDVRDRYHSEAELLDVLAAARCAVLPYPRHYGMSRVLLEAAVAKTPMVVQDFGLMGHLVREHGLGRAVDCGRPGDLSEAINHFALTDAVSPRDENFDRFSAQYSPEAFKAALSTMVARNVPNHRA